MNGSQLLMELLLEQGVERIFGYPGGAVLNIYDALYQYSDRIQHVITAHEQGACHAADGYARLTGKTGVVLATSGPGSTNLVTGIATAYMDSSPLVAITGNVGTGLIGRDSFQEVYIAGITMPITKHNFVVRHVDELAGIIRAAFRIAAEGRPGPVLVDIPKDVSAQEAGSRRQEAGGVTQGFPLIPDSSPLQEAGSRRQEAGGVTQGSPLIPDSSPLQEAGSRRQEAGGATQGSPLIPDSFSLLEASAALINGAKRPVIYFGGGVNLAGAGELLRELCRKAQIPAVHTLMAAGVLGYEEECNLGLIGMHGNVAANRAVYEADVLLIAGARLSDRVALNPAKFAPHAKRIQIDVDPAEINKNVTVHCALPGDVKEIFAALLPRIEERGHPEWSAKIATWKAREYQPQDDDSVLKPHQVMRTISEIAGEEAIYVTDVGQHQLWAAQYVRHLRPRSFITSGGLGTMGFGYGAAIGASFSAGARPVVHITGDGSFHMNLNEACTAVSYGAPVVTVIFNNTVLGMVRQWQTAFYQKRYSATDPQRKTDFVKLAAGFGLPAFRCANLAEFRGTFAKALSIAHGAVPGPVWVECPIDKDERVLPMIPAGGSLEDMIMD
ncbi:MAG: acetolactate synthase large subunit [Oscillospiraceae bacterium]|jgi:acetolactate synthase-1/2/3 large subunit|nr:acetolactate synthase large subunit [Oscillospiraceae bacterium]